MVESIEGNDKLIGRGDKKDQVVDLFMPPIRKETPSFEAQDLLIEVNLRTDDEPRQTKISGLLG